MNGVLYKQRSRIERMRGHRKQLRHRQILAQICPGRRAS
jgi:hypothetical protein